ncbi:MAG: site-2 protease family protein [Candidatus ainarchaeum sp.]|nr:site-2 protease family protein [Candidatus ainarchaeum sp.]
MELVEIAAWAIGILLFLIITTFLLKKFAKAQTFYIGSMIKTTKPLPLFDRFAEHKTILNAFADFGLVLGFGAIGIDYLFGKKLKAIPRIILFIASIALLTIAFNLVFSSLLSSPFTEKYSYLMALGFGVMGFAGFMVVTLAVYAEYVITNALMGAKSCPGVAPLIPGVSLPKFPVTIPLHGWISLLIILIVHEGMHGILARKALVKIKSTGLLLIGIFPIGAFVEPDEGQLKRTREKDQLRVFSAGPTANLAAAAVFAVLYFTVFAAIINVSLLEYKQNVAKVVISNVDQNIDVCGQISPSPAFGKLDKNMVVIAINGKNISSAEDWSNQLREIGKNTYFLTLQKDQNSPDKNVFQATITPDSMGYQGYTVQDQLKPDTKFSPYYIYFVLSLSFISSFLFWFWILNFLVGIANFMPLEPFDGGKITKLILLPYLGFWKVPQEQKEKAIGKIFFWLVLALLILNAVPFLL